MNDREMAMLRRVVVSSMAEVMAAAGDDYDARIAALEAEFAGAPSSIIAAADREADALRERAFLEPYIEEIGDRIRRICEREAELEEASAHSALSRVPAWAGNHRLSSSHLDDDIPF